MRSVESCQPDTHKKIREIPVHALRGIAQLFHASLLRLERDNRGAPVPDLQLKAHDALLQRTNTQNPDRRSRCIGGFLQEV